MLRLFTSHPLRHRIPVSTSTPVSSAPTHHLLRTMSTSSTPMEDAIRTKIQSALSPSTLVIRNDSHLHAHHAPMQGVTSRETHFHVTIISPAFTSKPQAARHRMVYALLKDEMAAQNGIHALQLRTRTEEEELRDAERKRVGPETEAS